MFKCFKRSFIKEYYLGLIKKQIVNIIYLFNILIPKNTKTIVALVDFENIDGRMVPYKNDNVYLLCEYIKTKRKDLEITYIPSNQFGGKTNKVLSRQKRFEYFLKRLRAKMIISKQPPHTSEYFTKKQHIISLGYFIPFKADYWDFKKWEVFYAKILGDKFDIKNCSIYREKVLEHFTYQKGQFNRTNFTMITSSDYASKTIARSHNLPIQNFKVLGSPKSDRQKAPDITIQEIFDIPDTKQSVVLYTPTFRDILIHKNINDAKALEKTIFYYEDEKEKLENFLVENNILLVIKLHKSFSFYRELEKLLIKEDKSYFKNCYFLDFELEAKYSMSIYQLFELSDAMIADYSSISFDYLPYDKPVIYNVPDIEEYRQYRGFSYEPIEEMMAGDIVQSVDELKYALLQVKHGIDKHKDKRKKVLSIVNEIPQGQALENIYNYVIEVLNR